MVRRSLGRSLGLGRLENRVRRELRRRQLYRNPDTDDASAQHAARLILQGRVGPDRWVHRFNEHSFVRARLVKGRVPNTVRSVRRRARNRPGERPRAALRSHPLVGGSGSLDRSICSSS